MKIGLFEQEISVFDVNCYKNREIDAIFQNGGITVYFSNKKHRRRIEEHQLFCH